MGKVIDPIQNSFLQAIRANRVVNRHTPMAYFLVFPKHYKLTVRVTYCLANYKYYLIVLFDELTLLDSLAFTNEPARLTVTCTAEATSKKVVVGTK